MQRKLRNVQGTKCERTPEGNMIECVSVHDNYQRKLLHPKLAILVDRVLTEWFDRVHEYTSKVEGFKFPDPIAFVSRWPFSGRAIVNARD